MHRKAFRLRLAAVPLAAALLGIFAAVTPASAATTSIVQASSQSAVARTYSAVGARISVDTGIQEQPCTSGRATWVHMTMSEDGSLVNKCYGYSGIFYFSANSTYYVCAGNNYGTMYYYDPHQGKYETWTFAPGHVIGWTYAVDISWLNISGWNGDSTC
jgi:hypothetical protein